jgi:hypothetical protein
VPAAANTADDDTVDEQSCVVYALRITWFDEQSTMNAWELSPPKPATGMHCPLARPATLTVPPAHVDPLYMVAYAHDVAPVTSVVCTAAGTWYLFLSVNRLPTNPYLVKNVCNMPFVSV